MLDHALIIIAVSTKLGHLNIIMNAIVTQYLIEFGDIID